jgi:hypothetical protein
MYYVFVHHSEFVPLLVKERKKICPLCKLEEDKDRKHDIRVIFLF